MTKHNIGSRFDDFLIEDGLLDEVTAVAVKRVAAWQNSEGSKSTYSKGINNRYNRPTGNN